MSPGDFCAKVEVRNTGTFTEPAYFFVALIAVYYFGIEFHILVAVCFQQFAFGEQNAVFFLRHADCRLPKPTAILFYLTHKSEIFRKFLNFFGYIILASCSLISMTKRNKKFDEGTFSFDLQAYL